MHLPRGDLWRADGGSGRGVGGRGGCRLTVKGMGAFALANGDPRRHAESRKMARSKIYRRVLGLPLPWMWDLMVYCLSLIHI